jgi:hypothetical protein
VRLSVVLLLLSLAGIVGGAALIAPWAVGLAVIADSVAVGAYALLREPESRPAPSVAEVPTLAAVLEKARRAG